MASPGGNHKRDGSSKFRRAFSWLRTRESLYRWLCFLCAFASILITFSIVFMLGREAIAFFRLKDVLVPAQAIEIEVPGQSVALVGEGDGEEVTLEAFTIRVGVEDQILYQTAGDVQIDMLSNEVTLPGNVQVAGTELRATVSPAEIKRATADAPTVAQLPRQALEISVGESLGYLSLPEQDVEVLSSGTRPQVTPGEFYGGTEFAPTFTPPKFGVLPLINGTLLITFGAALVAVPLGLLSAIYLAEYCRPGLRRWLKPSLEVLAGVPTIVYGYFALFHITPFLRDLFGEDRIDVFNAASGAVVVGIMTLPMVASLCDDAIMAVPNSLREGGNAMGATKFEVIKGIIVPGALSGVMAAFILAVSRAIGETMAVTLASGQTPNMTWDLGESIQTMTSFIVQISKGDAPAGGTAYLTLFAVGATLFLITFLLNWLARLIVRRYGMKYK